MVEMLHATTNKSLSSGVFPLLRLLSKSDDVQYTDSAQHCSCDFGILNTGGSCEIIQIPQVNIIFDWLWIVMKNMGLTKPWALSAKERKWPKMFLFKAKLNFNTRFGKIWTQTEFNG